MGNYPVGNGESEMAASCLVLARSGVQVSAEIYEFRVLGVKKWNRLSSFLCLDSFFGSRTQLWIKSFILFHYEIRNSSIKTFPRSREITAIPIPSTKEI